MGMDWFTAGWLREVFPRAHGAPESKKYSQLLGVGKLQECRPRDVLKSVWGFGDVQIIQ